MGTKLRPLPATNQCWHPNAAALHTILLLQGDTAYSVAFKHLTLHILKRHISTDYTVEQLANQLSFLTNNYKPNLPSRGLWTNVRYRAYLSHQTTKVQHAGIIVHRVWPYINQQTDNIFCPMYIT